MLCLRAFSDGVSGSELRYRGGKYIPIEFFSSWTFHCPYCCVRHVPTGGIRDFISGLERDRMVSTQLESFRLDLE